LVYLQTLLSALTLASILVNGNFLLRKTLAFRLKGIVERIVVSYLFGSAILILMSLVVGLVGLLQICYWVYFLAAAPIILSQTIPRIRTFHKPVELRLPSRVSVILVIVATVIAILRLQQSLTGFPGYDALEVTLPSARLFYQDGSIPAISNIYLQNGNRILIPPGVSILYAYVFTILSSVDSSTLSLLEVSYYLALGATVYSLTRRCGGDKTTATFASGLLLLLPLWNSYFLSLLRYADITASFVAASSVLLFVAIHKDYRVRDLGLLWLCLFATATSKINGLAVIGAILVVVLREMHFPSRSLKAIVFSLACAVYAVALAIYLPLSYTSATFASSGIDLLAFGLSSTFLLAFALFAPNQMPSKPFRKGIGLIVAILLSPLWLLRDWLLTGSPFAPVQKTGDAAWAAPFLSSTAPYSGLQEGIIGQRLADFLRYFSPLFVIPLVILIIVGWTRVYRAGSGNTLKTWVLVGASFFIGPAVVGDMRYILYFIPAAIVIAAVGLTYLVGKVTSSTKMTSARTGGRILDLSVAILLLVLTVSSYLAYLPMMSTSVAQSPYSTVANEIASLAEPGMIVSFGTTGAYYLSGRNVLNIVYPDTLGILRPCLQQEVSTAFSCFLRIGIRGAALPSEENVFWYSWFHSLLYQLPTLRVLQDSNAFKIVSFDKYGWYVSNVSNSSIPQYGILDIVARGNAPASEASLFASWDYNQTQVSIGNTRNGLSLITYLYFPDSMTNTSEPVSIVSEANVTAVNNFGTYETYGNITINTKETVVSDRIVEVNLGQLLGNESSQFTSVRLNSIQIRLLQPMQETYVLTSLSTDGSWLTYYPETALWTLSGSSLALR